MIKATNRKVTRLKRHRRIRNKILGTSARPRLCVFRSNKHIYAQIIDDSKAHTLAAASTLDQALKASVAKPWNKHGAEAVGQLIAERARAAGIDAVVFDRGGNIFHGRIKAVAEAARKQGLQF